MAALDFPSSPTVGQQYPSPAVAGVPVYTWDGEKWTTKGGAIGSTGASDALPLVDGSAAAGSSTLWSRGDHVHPTDPSIATKASVGSTAPPTNGVAAAGSATTAARSDHVHPTNFRDAQHVILGTGVDLNTNTSQGYFAVQSPVNGPTGTSEVWFYIRTQVHVASPAYIVQTADTLTVQPPQRWMRTGANGTWSAWVRLLDNNQIATYSEYRNNTAGKILTTDQVWTAAIPATLSDASGTITPNFDGGFDFVCVLSGAGRTFANPTGTQRGGQKGVIHLVQDGTGSRTITTWGTNYKFPGGVKPTLSTAVNAVDVISYVIQQSGWILCTFGADFK